MYGSNGYGSNEYAGLQAFSTPSPNAVVNLNGLGSQGRFSLVFTMPNPAAQGTIVNLNSLGPNGRLILYLNRNYNPVADAGELWKRVPRHSDVFFRP